MPRFALVVGVFVLLTVFARISIAQQAAPAAPVANTQAEVSADTPTTVSLSAEQFNKVKNDLVRASQNAEELSRKLLNLESRNYELRKQLGELKVGKAETRPDLVIPPEEHSSSEQASHIASSLMATNSSLTPQKESAKTKKWWSTESAMTMCATVLAFGLVVILLASLAIRRCSDQNTTLKAVVIPLVIVSAVFLVVAGYSDSQIAPAMGILGTIIGYVLGGSKEGPRGALQSVPRPGSEEPVIR